MPQENSSKSSHRFSGFSASDFSYFALAKKANQKGGGHPLRRRAEEQGREVQRKLKSLGEALLPTLWRLLPDMTMHVGGLGAGRLARSLFLAWFRRKAGHFARDLQIALELGEEGLRIVLRFGAARSAPELLALRKRFFAALRKENVGVSLLETLQNEGFSLRSEGVKQISIEQYLTKERGRVLRHRSKEQVIERAGAIIADLAADIDQLFSLYRYAVIQEKEPENSLVASFLAFANTRGFLFSEDLITTLIASLWTRPFVILAGVSGTGKTKLAQLLSEFFSGAFSSNPRIAFVPVRPDWLDPRGFLGFHDLLHERYEATPFLELLLHAKEDSAPHFVILDEMNLARPEYFLADILAVLESRRFEANGQLVSQGSISLHGAVSSLPIVDKRGKSHLVPREIFLPPNVYIIGTINIDESSFALSSRLYDRASVIELFPMPLHEYFVALSQKKESFLAPGASYFLREQFIREGLYSGPVPFHKPLSGREEFLQELSKIYELMKQAGTPFGIRSAQEAFSFALHAKTLSDRTWRWSLDKHIAIRIVPRLLSQLPFSLDSLRVLLGFVSNESTEDIDALLEIDPEKCVYPQTAKLLCFALRQERKEEIIIR